MHGWLMLEPLGWSQRDILLLGTACHSYPLGAADVVCCWSLLFYGSLLSTTLLVLVLRKHPRTAAMLDAAPERYRVPA